MESLAQNGTEPTSTPVTEFKFLQANTGRFDYEKSLLKLVLDASRQKYGDYTLRYINFSYGTARGRRELGSGERFNINAAPIRPSAVARQENVIVVPVPIMKGLLGYRALIVHKKNYQAFLEIERFNELTQYTIGQGKGWLDNKVYRDSGFNVMDISRYEQLFSMLNRNRFDALPLGITEVETELEKSARDYDSFKIVPNLVIYYPFPLVFQVSGNHPLIAERIEFGLTVIQNNGEFDKHFSRHFDTVIQRFLNEKSYIVPIKNLALEDDFGLTSQDLRKVRILPGSNKE